MKNYLVFILLFIVLSSCSSHEERPPSPIDSLKSNLTSGSWTIGHYSHGGLTDGIDHTAIYTGYVLTFKSNGTIVATNNIETINGSYTVRSEKFDNYFSYNYLSLNFKGSPIFQNLNSSYWSVYGNYTEINLQIGLTDFLTFIK